MRNMRRRFLVLAGGLFALVVGSLPSAAQTSASTWPQRPVKFILTLGGGSGTDIGMRMVADRLSKIWGQPVVIENKPGGDAIVAITSFLSANDDHVFLASPSSAFTHHPYVQQNLPYKAADFVPIARGWTLLIVIGVPAELPVNSLKELVAMAKAQPGKLNWAGTTGAIDFTFAGFLKKNGLDMARVPYRNPQDAANDLATGRIEVAEASLATLRPQLQAGKIKLLATTASSRDPAYPDLPTVKEAGFPELTLDGLVGLFGLQSTPPALRERIAADFRQAADDPTIAERLAATGQTLSVGGPAEFTKSIDEQRATVAAAAKDQGLSASQ